MKNLSLKFVVLIAILSTVCCKKQQNDQILSTEKTASVGKIETASFTVSGMSCAVMCANKIEKELTALKGVQKATVDFNKKLATVKYDSEQLSPEKIVATVEAVAGGELYKVSNLKCSANKAELFQEKEKTRKERRAERRAKKESDAADAAAKSEPTATKAACCSGKKTCGTSEKASTL